MVSTGDFDIPDLPRGVYELRGHDESRWRYAGGIVLIAGPRGPLGAAFLGETNIHSRYRTQV